MLIIQQMIDFRQALNDCNLADIGAACGFYTWSDSHTKERLDRGACSSNWQAFLE